MGFIAIYEKARGNKTEGKKSGPGKMDSALKESRSYNENNITALKCSYPILGKHPSQFQKEDKPTRTHEGAGLKVC